MCYSKYFDFTTIFALIFCLIVNSSCSFISSNVLSIGLSLNIIFWWFSLSFYDCDLFKILSEFLVLFLSNKKDFIIRINIITAITIVTADVIIIVNKASSGSLNDDVTVFIWTSVAGLNKHSERSEFNL